MGTSYHITVVTPPSTIDRQYLHWQIQNELQKIDDLLSTWDEDSELRRFNRAVPNRWFHVSDSTAEVAHLSLEVSRLTEGNFDPTVLPLVRLWQFDSSRFTSEFKPPSAGQIEKALESIGFQNLQVRRHPPALNKKTQLELDFSGVAKGYAVDKLVALLENYGITNFLVELGGEVRVRGRNPEQQPWEIAIAAPDVGVAEAAPQYSHVVQMDRPAAIATSGDYQNYFTYEGKRYSHLLNPATGYPVDHTIASVTVIDFSAARADAIATALLVLGKEKALQLAKKINLAVLMLVRVDGELVTVMSDDFIPWLLEASDG